LADQRRSPRRRVLAVRLDSDGDVLLTGPAVRALRAHSDHLALLVSPAGAAAAALLPDIDDVLVFDPPWSGYAPAPVDPEAVDGLVHRLRGGGYDEAVIFTSFHQSPLPIALLVRLAGIGRVSASSEDYPGSLLDVRHRRMPAGANDDGGPDGGHEVEHALALVRAAGFDLPPGDDAALRIRRRPPGESWPSPEAHGPLLDVIRPYVVVHPVASVPARSMAPAHARAMGEQLQADGWTVVVTGGPADVAAAAVATPPGGHDLAGATSLGDLAEVLAGAACLVAGNTGPAHLSAAVGTPVVCLFSPVVPAERWRPWQVPHVLLGDQHAPCRGTRARECPVPGHPCLGTVSPTQVADAVRRLAGAPRERGAEPLDQVSRRPMGGH
jgi:heptosyltransferase III